MLYLYQGVGALFIYGREGIYGGFEGVDDGNGRVRISSLCDTMNC
jgi:hypothetical protein